MAERMVDLTLTLTDIMPAHNKLFSAPGHRAPLHPRADPRAVRPGHGRRQALLRNHLHGHDRPYRHPCGRFLPRQSRRCAGGSDAARHVHGQGRSAGISPTFPTSAISTSPTSSRRKRKAASRWTAHIVLLNTGLHNRHYPDVKSVWSNPGITAAATHWLADRGSKMHGVEGPSTDKPSDNLFPNHRVCRDRGIAHYEWLINLEELVGEGRVHVLWAADQDRQRQRCAGPAPWAILDE